MNKKPTLNTVLLKESTWHKRKDLVFWFGYLTLLPTIIIDLMLLPAVLRNLILSDSVVWRYVFLIVLAIINCLVFYCIIEHIRLSLNRHFTDTEIQVLASYKKKLKQEEVSKTKAEIRKNELVLKLKAKKQNEQDMLAGRIYDAPVLDTKGSCIGYLFYLFIVVYFILVLLEYVDFDWRWLLVVTPFLPLQWIQGERIKFTKAEIYWIQKYNLFLKLIGVGISALLLVGLFALMAGLISSINPTSIIIALLICIIAILLYKE